ncbi:DNA cytosine methyltransferase [Streptomyces sp. MH191]|uniref:DNA cytosine methyltransferase n=2 Tax=unclassified Streptomyces TaxID=2593676 RepID=UPI0032D9C92C
MSLALRATSKVWNRRIFMPRSVELFAGGGGMALGMHKAGFEHEQLVEIVPSACEILRVNAMSHPHIWKPDNVRETDVQEWLEELPQLNLADIDLVAGGPPCQPFSISGRHAGHGDVRNMFPAAIETVRLLGPKMFVFENVPGLLRDSFLPYYQYIMDQLSKPEVRPKAGELWEVHHKRVVSSRASGLQYHVFRHDVNAADFGVPQNRRRVFLIGIRTDLLEAQQWRMLSPTHSLDALLYSQWVDGTYWDEWNLKRPKEEPPRMAAKIRRLREVLLPPTDLRWQTVRDAISGLPDPVEYTDAEGVLNHWGIPGARTYKGHTGSHIDSPSKTLKAGVHGVCGGEGMIRFNDESVRYLTIRESARIQSFPDWYDIVGTRTKAMRALGNAVAVDVAAAIGQHLRSITGI